MSSIAASVGRSRPGRGFTPKVAILVLLLALGIVPPFLFLLFSSLHQFNPDGSYGPFSQL